MDVLAERFDLSHCANDAIAEVVRMRAGEAESAYSGYTADSAQQISEVVSAVEVGVHRLTQQHNLRYTGIHHGLGFPHHLCQLATSLRATRRRDDAVSALVVAPTLDGDPRLHAVKPARGEILVMLLEIELDGGRAQTNPRVFDQRRKLAVAVGSDDQAYVLYSVEQLGSQSLRHAAGDAENRIPLHPALHLAEASDHPLLRVIANSAGIDQNDVGTIRLLDGIVARCRQLAEHQLGVADIH